MYLASIGAKTSAQIRLGRPIAKRILAINPDQTTAYIPRRQAELEVRAYSADWDDIVTRTRIYRRLKCDRGPISGNFCDSWQIKPSGGVPVWQYQP